VFDPLNAELNLICHLLALLGAYHIVHVSEIRDKVDLLTCCSDQKTCCVNSVTLYIAAVGTAESLSHAAVFVFVCVCVRACVCVEGVERRCVGSTYTASVTRDVSEQDTKSLSGACTVFPFLLVSPVSAKQ